MAEHTGGSHIHRCHPRSGRGDLAPVTTVCNHMPPPPPGSPGEPLPMKGSVQSRCLNALSGEEGPGCHPLGAAPPHRCSVGLGAGICQLPAHRWAGTGMGQMLLSPGETTVRRGCWVRSGRPSLSCSARVSSRSSLLRLCQFVLSVCPSSRSWHCFFLLHDSLRNLGAVCGPGAFSPFQEAPSAEPTYASGWEGSVLRLSRGLWFE